MRIAVDARELAGHPTGVGRYLAELVGQWSDSAEALRHEWHLYAHTPLPVVSALSTSVVVLPGAGGSQWEQWTLARRLRRDRPDVLFAPGYTAPLMAPCPTALTIHDISFAAHPEWFAWREGVRRRTLTAWSARRARVVLTDSAFSGDEITRWLGLPRARLRVIPLGITRRARGEPNRGEAREPMILFVGSIFERRHVDRLIAAFVQSVAPRVPNARLEIVGDNRTSPLIDFDATLRSCAPDVARRVSLRSYVDDSTLDGLYSRAAVFAFPSEYEGFGLTPLEALAAGIPPVVLDTSIAREIYGRAARYVSPDLSNPAPLADAIIDLLRVPAARASVLDHAPEVLARYDWRRTADATLAAIEEAAGV